MHYIESGSQAYHRALMGMLLGSIVTFAILYCPQPLIADFSEQYNVSPSTASFAISFSTAALAVSMLFVSVISNAWGRKRLMSLSLLLTSMLAILSSFSHDFHLLLLLRLLTGISLAGFPSIAMAYLNEEFSPAGIGKIMGIYIGGTAIGGFAGRIIIGVLTDFFSWNTALLVLGLASLLCSLWFWVYLPESNHFHRVRISLSTVRMGLKESLIHKKLLRLYIIGFLLMGAYVTLFNYIGLPLTEAPYNLSQTALGFLFIINLTGLWSSVLFGRLADRYPRSLVMGSTIVLLAVGALLTLNHHLFFKIAGMTLFAFGFFGGHTIVSGWVGLIAPKENKAQAASLYLLFYYSGSSLVGWLGGFFWSFFRWNGVILMICVLLAVAFLLSPQPLNQVRCWKKHSQLSSKL